MPGTPALDFIQVTEQCAAGCGANGSIPNLVYRAGSQGTSWQSSNNWRAPMWLVERTHSMKFAYKAGSLMDDRFPTPNTQLMTSRMNTGKPNKIKETID